jgi:Double zinc ribbon/Clp amino terminal domain, pathogenicity island component
MDEKQTKQHRQHFNLSDAAKQMLEELTAKRYPGKQRRQSQLVEDLISEAFAKERNMSTVTTGLYDPEPNGLEPATTEAINLAHQEAARMAAVEVYPEHLLLGVIAQGESKAAKLLCMYGMDMQAIRLRATELFSSHYRGSNDSDPALSEESQECIERAISLAVKVRAPSVTPEHLVVSVLHYPTMQPLRISFLPEVGALMIRLGEGMRSVYVAGARQQESSKVQEGSFTESTNQAHPCPSCQSEVQPKWKHCVYCGASLARVCPNCGTLQPEVAGARFCFECGSALE